MPENREALRIWPIVQGQVIVGGMGEIVGLNHLSVWKDIDRFGVEGPLACFKKILVLFRHFREKEGQWPNAL
jgi:hypothetical protein